MPRYLTFALVAPVASFGAVAVGERRSGWDRPGRSAVLGLIGACLGIERTDTAGQEALAVGYNLALRCHAPGRLLADYHTAQVPPSQRGRRFATRREELAVPREQLGTVLSRRDYRVGAWHLAAVWPRDGARWTLEEVASAMERPVFAPFLGRRACPLGLPLAPRILDATDAIAALATRHVEGPEAGWRASMAEVPYADDIVALDAAELGDLPGHRRTEIRRDQPLSRTRWQFGLREEAVVGGAP